MTHTRTPPEDRFGRILHFVDSQLAKVEDSSNLIAGVLIFGLMALGVVGIFMQAFELSTFGFRDVIEFSMVGFAVLSIAYVQRIGTHVRMELLLTKLKGRWLWTTETLGALFAAAIVFILIPSSYQHFGRAFELGDSTMNIELPTWPPKLLIPLALSLLLLRILIQLGGYLRLLWNPRLEPIAIPIIQSAAEKIRTETVQSGKVMQ